MKYFGKGSKKFQSFIAQYKNIHRPTIPQSEETREKEVSQVKAYIDSGYSALPKQGDGVYSLIPGGHTYRQRTKRLSAEKFIFGKIS